MATATTLIIRGLKIAARAGIRVSAVIGAYLLVSGNGVTAEALLRAVDAAWLPALVFAALGLALDLAFRTDRALWRYVSIVDIGPIVRTSTTAGRSPGSASTAAAGCASTEVRPPASSDSAAAYDPRWRAMVTRQRRGRRR